MKKYFPVLLLLFSVGCELIVDIDVPFEKKSITVNSFINPDSLFSARITANRFILDNGGFDPIENAQVIIYHSDEPIDTLISEGNGKYKSDTGKPEQGKSYVIKAVSENYEPVIGTSVIPERTEILNAETSSPTTANGQFENVLKIKFKDQAGTKNYYEVSMEVEYEFYDRENDRIVYQRQQFSLQQVNGSDDDEALASSYRSRSIVKDLLFDGKEVELSFKVLDFFMPTTTDIVINLKTVSEDYYKYQTTKNLQEQTSGDPLAQPVNVYNNIGQGFGIFAGYNSSVFVVQTPRPVITGFTPSTGKPGDVVTITGENLAGENSTTFVSFNGAFETQLLTVSDTEIKAIVPAQVTSGKIVVFLSGKVAVSATDFEIE